MRRLISFIIWISLGLMGCASSRQDIILPRERMVTTASGQADEYIEEADDLVKGSLDQKDFERAIELYQKAYGSDPFNKCLLIQLSRTYYILATVFLEDDESKNEAYRNGKDFGLIALYLNREFKEAIERGKSFTWSLKKYTYQDDAVPLYWTTLNWYKWGELNGLLKLSSSLPKIKPMVDRLIFLDEICMNGGPHRLLGIHYALIPSFAGRDLNKSMTHFTRAIEIEPNYLENYVEYARYYAVAKGDRNLFKSLLQKALDFPVSSSPDFIQENRRAKHLAERMLNEMDSIFNKRSLF